MMQGAGAVFLRHVLALFSALAGLALALPLLQSPGSIYTAFDRQAFGHEFGAAAALLVAIACMATALEMFSSGRAAALARGSILAAQVLGLLHIARIAWIDTASASREVKIVVAMVATGAALALALRMEKTRLRRVSEALVITTFLAFALHPGLLVYVFDRPPAHAAAPSATPSGTTMGQPGRPRPVVFVLLDELDAEIALREGFFELPEIRSLVGRGALGLQMQPGGPNTLRSIPTMLTGRTLSNIANSGPAFLEARDGTRWDAHTEGLFSDLDTAGVRYSIVGFYHDYCRIAPRAASCFAQPVRFFSGWMSSLTRTLKGRANLQYAYQGFLQQWAATLDSLTSESIEAIRRRHADLVWLHINLPHPPAAGREGPRSLAEDYAANLRIAASFVGRLETELRQIGDDHVIVVTSDHWLREHELWRDIYSVQYGQSAASTAKTAGRHEVPLLVGFGRHAPGGGAQIGVTDATIVRRLLVALSSRELNTPADVAAWTARQQPSQ
jgi:Sulfatase